MADDRDDGLMIDLSLMKSARIDPAARRAYVEPGCTLADFDHEAQAFGLAVPLAGAGAAEASTSPVSQVPTLKGSGAVDVRSVASNQTMYLGFNDSSGPTANPLRNPMAAIRLPSRFTASPDALKGPAR